jgi:WD40 repeat protein
MDGTLDVWDYYYKQNDPTLTVQVADKCLTSVSPESNGRMLAVGAADASVTLLELCDGLCMMQTGEKVRALPVCLPPCVGLYDGGAASTRGEREAPGGVRRFGHAACAPRRRRGLTRNWCE